MYRSKFRSPVDRQGASEMRRWRVDLLTPGAAGGIVIVRPDGAFFLAPNHALEMDRMTSTHTHPRHRFRLVPTALLLATLGLPALLAQDVRAQQMDAGPSTVESLFQDMAFRNVGPSRGGRVTAVAGHRDHPYTFYMGATGGGVWKTEDYGTTWRPIADGILETGSIGSIRVARSNSNVVYVGTGSDGIRSNVNVGRGAYRSDDAGATWRKIGLEQMGPIGSIEIHPEDADVAYAAALGNPWAKSMDRGVYRTRDGGRNWEQVLFTSDSVGAIDLEINPANPNEIYAAMWRGRSSRACKRRAAKTVSGSPPTEATRGGSSREVCRRA